MPVGPGDRRSVLVTVLVLGALVAAVGCGSSGGPSREAATSLDAEPVGAATLFPGSDQEQGEDVEVPQTDVGEPTARDVEVRNTSDEPMTVDDVSATGFEVSEDTCTGSTVESGEACTFQLLGPADGQATTGSVTVKTNQGSITSSLSSKAVEVEDDVPTPEETQPTDVPTPSEETDILPTEDTDIPTEEETDIPTEEPDIPTELPDVPDAS
ncbi:hypothetical protein ACFZCL_37600 [Streptomyces sp. NPDC008159]|uniref:hypothetical protein n=1 Tax=Streptomyces sp. NPDC008159 TaxID=3364817 RepID=UPI0036E1B7A9